MPLPTNQLSQYAILIVIVICFSIVVFLIQVMIIRWIFRINDIADALKEIAYYKKIDSEK